MPKISKNQLDAGVYARIGENLAAALAAVTARRDMERFMGSLFTETERLMLAKRLAIAVLLAQGWSYSRISKALKVSSVTVGFVRNSVMKNNRAYTELIRQLSHHITIERVA